MVGDREEVGRQGGMRSTPCQQVKLLAFWPRSPKTGRVLPYWSIEKSPSLGALKNAESRRAWGVRGPETADGDLPFVPAHPSKVVGRLHPQPHISAAAERFLETHGHLRRHGALAADDIIKLLARHPEGLRRPSDAQAKLL